jgi:hypothetical protein
MTNARWQRGIVIDLSWRSNQYRERIVALQYFFDTDPGLAMVNLLQGRGGNTKNELQSLGYLCSLSPFKWARLRSITQY